MTHKQAKLRADRLFQSLERLSLPADLDDGGENTESLVSIKGQAVERVTDSSRLPRMKKFRFQLLHRWLTQNFEPCKAADIGGGKGLLSYLLINCGWAMTVIDPLTQPLPDKYKDIETGTRIKIDPQRTVPHLQAEFEAQQVAGTDLLIGLHAHGCNARIIDAAATYGCGFVIFPCCVIDEPFYPPLGVHWLESLADYAIRQGQTIRPFRLNFKGQNIGLYSMGKCQARKDAAALALRLEARLSLSSSRPSLDSSQIAGLQSHLPDPTSCVYNETARQATSRRVPLNRRP